MFEAMRAWFKGLRAPRVACAGTLLAAGIFAVGCSVGPNYKRPAAPSATKWDLAEPWREGAPKDSLPKGQWWAVFHDDDLNALETEALTANQTIKVSIARLEQARATAAIQISALFPTLSASPSVERQRLSGSRPTSGVLITLKPVTQNTFVLPFTVSYEVDLFGRRRRSIEAAEASYQANAADVENVRLLVAAQLAGDYFNLRELDSELQILTRTVEALQKGLDLVNSRHRGGVASGLDVAQEETLLNTTRTQAQAI
jgi:outer membrane protein, multidrug efflux system